MKENNTLLDHKKNDLSTVQLAKEHLKNILKNLSGIEGIGISSDNDGKFCLVVNVNPNISPNSKIKIPSAIDGYEIKTPSIPKAVLQKY